LTTIFRDWLAQAVTKTAASASRQRRGPNGRWVDEGKSSHPSSSDQGLPSTKTLQQKSHAELLALRTKTLEYLNRATATNPTVQTQIAYRQRQIDVHTQTIKMIDDEIAGRGRPRPEPPAVVQKPTSTTQTPDKRLELQKKLKDAEQRLRDANTKRTRTIEGEDYRQRQIAYHQKAVDKYKAELAALPAPKPTTPSSTTRSAAERFQAMKKTMDPHISELDALNNRVHEINSAIDDYSKTHTRPHGPTDPNYGSYYKGYNDLYGDFQDAIRAREAKKTEVDKMMEKHVFPENPASIKSTTNGYLSQKQKSTFRKGVARFEDLVGDGHAIQQHQIIVSSTNDRRSFHRTGDLWMSSKETDHNIVVHELGHALEYRSPSIQQRRQAFYNRRTAGESPVKLRDHTGIAEYKDNEYTRPDKFPDAYSGKVYNHPTSSEVISMGLQHMSESPSTFYHRDPDYFRFIMEIIHDVPGGAP
jgi:hypothetical protein